MTSECLPPTHPGILFLVDKLPRFILIACGLLSYAAPYQSIIALALLAITASSFVLATGTKGLILRAFSSALVLVLILNLNLDPSLGTSLLSALGLAIYTRKLLIPFLILLLQTSLVASTDAVLANALAEFHVESASSSLVCLGVVGIVLCSKKLLKHLLVTAFFVSLSAYFGYFIAASPLQAMGLTVTPLIYISYVLAYRSIVPSYLRLSGASLLVLVALVTASWIAMPPHQPDSRYLLLQDIGEEPEAKFYRSYKNVLDYTGLGFKIAQTPEEIPFGSLVLLPWQTKEFDADDDQFINHYRQIAQRENFLTVLVGEHDNMNGAAERINKFVGKIVINDDLTVPPSNRDESGLLRIADIKGWSPNAVLNRGASIKIHTPFDKPLLSGDGWWLEPNLKEWLWVGDYRWQPFNQYGRIILSGAYRSNGATWVVLGDSGPFLNLQILSDSPLTEHFLEVATLYPGFAKDLLLLIFAGILAVCVIWHERLYTKLATIFIIGVCIALGSTHPLSRTWSKLSGLDERNPNELLLKSPDLLKSGWQIFVPNNPIKQHTEIPQGNVVILGVIDSSYDFAGANLSDCVRLGNIKSEEGPFLLDAQSCVVSGDAKVLIGDAAGAAAVMIRNDNRSVIFILDKRFLAKNAPMDNLEWLSKTVAPN